jgi:adenylate cyclase class 2
MAFEVEMKFRAGDLDQVMGNLDRLGAEWVTLSEQEDIYVSHPSRDLRATDEALRIRRSGPENLVTYKGPKQGGPTKTREEIEIGFEPGDEGRQQMQTLFERLGFSVVAVIPKTRRLYKMVHEGLRLEVALDDVRGLGKFVEVETLAGSRADLPRAQAAVLAVASLLALEDHEPRSYLRMTLDQGVS